MTRTAPTGGSDEHCPQTDRVLALTRAAGDSDTAVWDGSGAQRQLHSRFDPPTWWGNSTPAIASLIVGFIDTMRSEGHAALVDVPGPV